MNRVGLWITLGIALLLGLLFFLFFEIKTVPNVKNRQSFSYEDKDPNGLYIFGEITKKYFEDKEVEFVETIPKEIDLKNALVVYFSKRIYFSERESKTINDYLDRGANILYFPRGIEEELLDSMGVGYRYDYQNLDTLKLTFVEDANSEVYEFALFEDDLKESKFKTLTGFVNEYFDEPQYLKVKSSDTVNVLSKFEVGNGFIHMHLFPELFFNKSYLNDDAFEYSQRLLHLTQPEKVFLTSGVLEIDQAEDRHPLEFIMSNPALKAAYLLFMFTLLIYAIFSGKRKQRVIPILKEKKNTSLEYIDTVSQLFYQQGQHQKLVKHMSEVFYHTMKKKYYIGPDHPEYVAILAKKSKLPTHVLSYVVNRFKNQEDNFSFTQDQLVGLHKRLEEIYKHINTKK